MELLFRAILVCLIFLIATNVLFANITDNLLIDDENTIEDKTRVRAITVNGKAQISSAQEAYGVNSILLYATFSTYSNNIDFLFIADQSGKLLNARTIINSMGREEFASTYLNNKNY